MASKSAPVTLVAQANIPVSMLQAAGAEVPDFMFERRGGARVERGTRILVMPEVATKLKEIKVLGHEPGYFNRYIPAFTISL